MLKQRIITAAVLLAVVLAALAAPTHWPVLSLWAISLAAAGWEWARLNGAHGAPAIALGAGLPFLSLGTLLALVWQVTYGHRTLPQGLQVMVLGPATLAWLAVAVCLLRGGTALWLRWPAWLRLLLGLLWLALAWFALMWLYIEGAALLLLSVMALVWVADITAYFTGRAIGGRFIARKLAPTVSPNKSWEGALGGALGTLLLAAIWVAADRAWGGESLYTRLLHAGGWVWLLLCTLLLTVASVLGDLVESQIKRAAGVKDSSNLLPGHGGVLDRVDALLPTMPLALALLGALA